MDELVKLLDGALQWSLEYDWHAGHYQTIDEWADAQLGICDHSPEEAAEIEACRAAGHVWWLQVYPTTPIGFYYTYAPTFEAVLEWARKLSEQIALELATNRGGGTITGPRL